MAIDLEQFHQVFFEESLEGLDIMESSLMELDPESVDAETINAIFRCAHSIKGGSATFGFTAISEFTHVLETLLDQVRSGERGINTDEVNLYLQSVDCMREMLAYIREGEPGLTEKSVELKQSFEALLNSDSASPASVTTVPDSDAGTDDEAVFSDWDINFVPDGGLFRSGNDPLRYIQSLAGLGEMKAECILASLPKLESIDPEICYLSWQIKLKTTSTKQDILEVFEWIEDDCELSIELSASEQAVETSNEENIQRWQIEFSPSLNILRTGNEPARIFRALADLGKVEVINVDKSKLPDLHSIDSESCYLSWILQLEASGLQQSDILEVFEWVEDEADIAVSLMTSKREEPAETKTEALVAPTTAAQTPAEAPVQKIAKAKPVKKAAAESASIRVGIDKVDNLINMVGELVITQSMLGQLGADFDIDRIPKLMEGLSQLEQNTRELQESVMKIRMLPISFAFSRFPRMIRDLSQTLGKSVELELRGENTELDKTVMEKIGDPLVHLVRNAVDHGIEKPEARSEKGKDPSGKIILNAFHQSGNVVIEIIDDGKGLDRDGIIKKATENGLLSDGEGNNWSDEQVFDLIFQPGFSTAQTVSDVSGRGVGMDVVKRNIQALGGVVEINSKRDQGSKITIKLPLTLAILDGQLVRVGNQTYIFPLISIIESMQCRKELVNRVAGGCNVFKLRDDYVPIIELYKSFSIEPDSTELESSLIVVVEVDGDKVGIVVDELLAQQQVVIKSLEQNYKRVKGVSGATILGDGTVALILDIPGIIKMSGNQIGVSTKSLGTVIHSHDLMMVNASSGSQSVAH